MSESTTTVSISSHLLDSFSSKIEELQIKLRENAPGYESLLHTIHRQLSQDESLVHLLTEEQVGVIVSGLTRRKNIILAEPEKKSSGKNAILPGGKRLKDLTMEDFE